MNKQELIEKLKIIDGGYGSRYYIAISDVFELLEQLDEPQKPVVPQFVADWIEKNKGSLFGLNYDSVSSEIYDWVYEEEGNLKKLHFACAIGYTVEKEKKYRVSLKNGQPLIKAPLGGNFYFTQNITAGGCKATRKELEEAGFGDVFNSPLFEVEEVKR